MQQKQYDDARSLVEDVDFQGHDVVLIDGFMSSGKTTLSNVFSSKFSIIHLDDFVDKNHQCAFFEHIRWGDLSETVNGSSRPLIIEGVCALKVSERLGIKACVIYVKRRSLYGLWCDEDECLKFEPCDNVPPLHAEVRRYHLDYQPHKRADYILNLVEVTS